MASKGDLAIVTDHKHINMKQGDLEIKALGISALITDPGGVQHSILLAYIPTNSSEAELTTPMLDEILTRFDLMKAFEESKISFSIDGGMIKAVTDLFRNHEMTMPIITYCQTHNTNNVMKRTVKKNLNEYLPGGTERFEDLQKLISAMAKEIGPLLRNHEVSPGIRNKVRTCLKFSGLVSGLVFKDLFSRLVFHQLTLNLRQHCFCLMIGKICLKIKNWRKKSVFRQFRSNMTLGFETITNVSMPSSFGNWNWQKLQVHRLISFKILQKNIFLITKIRSFCTPYAKSWSSTWVLSIFLNLNQGFRWVAAKLNKSLKPVYDKSYDQ